MIADINRSRFSGAIADVNGVQYEGVSSATPEQISLGGGRRYGIVGVSWTKLPPKTLLAISASFIKPNEADAADRQWLCAVYASETGDAEAAQRLAEAAAKAKPEYREQIPLLEAQAP